MFNHLFIVLISSHLLLLTTCLIIHTQRAKDHEEICTNNRFRSISTNNLRVCYMKYNRDRSILVWFKTDKTFFTTYRFTLRSIDEISLSTINIHILTNFTELIDLNNSLRIFNLDSGQYEICLDFQSNLTSYIYSPRHGCIPIRIGELLHRSFKQSSTQLLITLGISIILFLILGLVVQSIKAKRTEKQQEISNNIKNISPEDEQNQRSPSSSILSTESLKNQRDRIIRRLLRRHIDQPDASHIRQWARNRAFRHRIATQEQEIESSKSTHRWNKQIPKTKTSRMIHSASVPTLTTNDIYTIPMTESLHKNSYSTLSEEFELL